MPRDRKNKQNRQRGPKTKAKTKPKPKQKKKRPKPKPKPKGRPKKLKAVFLLDDGLDEHMGEEFWFWDQGQQLIENPGWTECEYCHMAWQYSNVWFLFGGCFGSRENVEVVWRLSRGCQEVVKEVVKRLSRGCREVAKSCQKVVKELSSALPYLEFTCPTGVGWHVRACQSSCANR